MQTLLVAIALLALSFTPGISVVSDQARGGAEVQRSQAAQATTERERQSEQAYEKVLAYPRLGGGKDLRRDPSDVQIHLDELVHTDPLLSGSDQLKRSACESDVVALVRVVAERPFLTSDATFIMTEYTLFVSDVLRGTAFEREVRYVRPGGRMTVNGKSITATLSTIPLLEKGQQYLVFLSRDIGADFLRSRFESPQRLDILPVYQGRVSDSLKSPPALQKAEGLPAVVTAVRGVSCGGSVR